MADGFSGNDSSGIRPGIVDAGAILKLLEFLSGLKQEHQDVSNIEESGPQDIKFEYNKAIKNLISEIDAINAAGNLKILLSHFDINNLALLAEFCTDSQLISVFNAYLDSADADADVKLVVMIPAFIACLKNIEEIEKINKTSEKKQLLALIGKFRPKVLIEFAKKFDLLYENLDLLIPDLNDEQLVILLSNCKYEQKIKISCYLNNKGRLISVILAIKSQQDLTIVISNLKRVHLGVLVNFCVNDPNDTPRAKRSQLLTKVIAAYNFKQLQGLINEYHEDSHVLQKIFAMLGPDSIQGKRFGYLCEQIYPKVINPQIPFEDQKLEETTVINISAAELQILNKYLLEHLTPNMVKSGYLINKALLRKLYPESEAIIQHSFVLLPAGDNKIIVKCFPRRKEYQLYKGSTYQIDRALIASGTFGIVARLGDLIISGMIQPVNVEGVVEVVQNIRPRVVKILKNTEENMNEALLLQQYIGPDVHRFTRTQTQRHEEHAPDEETRVFGSGDSEDKLYIEQPEAPGVELYDLLFWYNLTEIQKLEIAFKMTTAVAKLHDLGIIHRDLKLENFRILANADGSGPYVVTLLDLGRAKRLEEGQTQFITQVGEPGALVGSLINLAPEILVVIRDRSGIVVRCKNPKNGQHTYSRASDCLALGNEFSGILIFPNPETLSLVQGLIDSEPQKRPTAAATSQTLLKIAIKMLIESEKEKILNKLGTVDQNEQAEIILHFVQKQQQANPNYFLTSKNFSREFEKLLVELPQILLSIHANALQQPAGAPLPLSAQAASVGSFILPQAEHAAAKAAAEAAKAEAARAAAAEAAAPKAEAAEKAAAGADQSHT